MKDIASKSICNIDDDDAEDEEDWNDIDQYDHTNGQCFTEKIPFRKSHPGYHFCHLANLKKSVIPQVYIPEGYLCKTELLDWTKTDNVNQDTEDARERYAKTALLMFYPHRTLNNLQRNGSCWNVFYDELYKHSNNEPTLFWKYGFTILQNIQDRMTMDKSVTRAIDRIPRNTVDKTPEETKKCSCNTKDTTDYNDITDFCQDTWYVQ